MRLAIHLSLLVGACAPVQPAPVSPSGDSALLAALFEDARLIEKGLGPDFACVSVHSGQNQGDPDSAVVALLAGRWKIPVIPGSRCEIKEDSSLVVTPGIGGTGKWLRVINLQCAGPNHCNADVGYYVANMGSGGRGVTAARTSSGWKITPTGRVWIS